MSVLGSPPAGRTCEKNTWIESRARPERRTKWTDGSESREEEGARQTKNKTERDPRGGGGSKRWRKASIIIIEGNGAEAPWSSALFYISSPDPDAPAPALGSSQRPPRPGGSPPRARHPQVLGLALAGLTHLLAGPSCSLPRPAASFNCDQLSDTDVSQSKTRGQALLVWINPPSPG